MVQVCVHIFAHVQTEMTNTHHRVYSTEMWFDQFSTV